MLGCVFHPEAVTLCSPAWPVSRAGWPGLAVIGLPLPPECWGYRYEREARGHLSEALFFLDIKKPD